MMNGIFRRIWKSIGRDGRSCPTSMRPIHLNSPSTSFPLFQFAFLILPRNHRASKKKKEGESQEEACGNQASPDQHDIGDAPLSRIDPTIDESHQAAYAAKD